MASVNDKLATIKHQTVSDESSKLSPNLYKFHRKKTFSENTSEHLQDISVTKCLQNKSNK